MKKTDTQIDAPNAKQKTISNVIEEDEYKWIIEDIEAACNEGRFHIFIGRISPEVEMILKRQGYRIDYNKYFACLELRMTSLTLWCLPHHMKLCCPLSSLILSRYTSNHLFFNS